MIGDTQMVVLFIFGARRLGQRAGQGHERQNCLKSTKRFPQFSQGPTAVPFRSRQNANGKRLNTNRNQQQEKRTFSKSFDNQKIS
jgi:hypothetical protein